MGSVAVFCAASESIDSCYVSAAREVGVMLARLGDTLVYGGARLGLMEATASAVKAAGGHVVGVVPHILEERGRVSHLLDEKIPCSNLSERKDIMLAQSDVLVALPGGIGTLDEIFHVAASATIGYHRKRVILYNVNGFWKGMIEMLRGMSSTGFLRGNVDDYILVADNIEELENIILKYTKWVE